MTSWGSWATVPSSFEAKVAVRVVPEPSVSSRIIQPKLVELPATKFATSEVTVPPTTYAPVDWFWHPAGVPTLNVPVRDPVAGLLIAVPNGWLFQVSVVSPQVTVGGYRSSTRQAAGAAVMYSRNVARRTVAEAGMAGLQTVRSN